MNKAVFNKTLNEESVQKVEDFIREGNTDMIECPAEDIAGFAISVFKIQYKEPQSFA